MNDEREERRERWLEAINIDDFCFVLLFQVVTILLELNSRALLV
jgi:hypothetical protein